MAGTAGWGAIQKPFDLKLQHLALQLQRKVLQFVARCTCSRLLLVCLRGVSMPILCQSLPVSVWGGTGGRTSGVKRTRAAGDESLHRL